jgi:hypothetical protein
MSTTMLLEAEWPCCEPQQRGRCMPQLPPCGTGAPVKSRGSSMSEVVEVSNEENVLSAAECRNSHRKWSTMDRLIISD